ncbi:hypothetical protein ACTHTV_21650, partial [Neisseria sp. P0015.S010]
LKTSTKNANINATKKLDQPIRLQKYTQSPPKTNNIKKSTNSTKTHSKSSSNRMTSNNFKIPITTYTPKK